jgi:hypothetical protein
MSRRIHPYLLNPAGYPDFTRRPYRVPTWETFDRVTQLTTLRSFTIRDDRLVNFREDLDLYRDLGLGRVIWPVFQTVFAENFRELVAEIKRRDLYLFDVWGHVPGSGYEGPWSHVMPPKGMVDSLQRELGDRFLGFDNGEQDGRYVGGYSNQQCPAFADRFRQYLNFQRHFQRMGDDLGNKLSTLVSLCFGHYFLKEGNHVLIGAETAQALPNSQVYYAFIRGAGKQYGIHWFGNASVFNRWAYKTYETAGDSAGYRCGPTEGTSLNLLRRLLYTHYLYNSVAIGFEQSWLMGDNTEKRLKGLPVLMEDDRSAAVLSPVGEIQSAAQEFVQKHGQPGVMLTPVALLLDHFSGWTMPRHLYTANVYQVWGAMPYESGDYLTHGVLSMLFPGYEDASYFHDERGFLSPTPYGDMADVLLSDVPEWILKQYGLLIVAGRLSVDAELADKLHAFIEQGGHLMVTAENARPMWPEWKIGEPLARPTDSSVVWADGKKTVETQKIPVCPAALPRNADVLARCKDLPLVARIRKGKGLVTLLLTPFGLNEKALVTGRVANEAEKKLACPFGLLKHVQRVLDDILTGQQLFSVGPGLSFITCRKGTGEYTLGVHNNDLFLRPLKIVSHVGKIQKITELPIDPRAKKAVGYWPTGHEKNAGGESRKTTIAGGDIRLFSISVKEEDVQVLPPVAAPTSIRDRFLAFRNVRHLKEAVLASPTFFHHFDGAMVDWTYLRDRDRVRAEYEAGWLTRQRLRVLADLRPGLNFYPDLTLLDTLQFRYDESATAIDDILDKMVLLGSLGAVVSLHRSPENHCDADRAHDRFLAGVRDLCRRAGERGITLYLESHPHKWHAKTEDMLCFIDKVNASNLRFALNAAHAVMMGEKVAKLIAAAGDRLGLVLLSAPRVDAFGQQYDAHLPIHTADWDPAPLKALNVPLVLDADYRSWDDTYRDIKGVEKQAAVLQRQGNF